MICALFINRVKYERTLQYYCCYFNPKFYVIRLYLKNLKLKNYISVLKGSIHLKIKL